MKRKKSSIYTRTGDRGQTGLVGGQRIQKSDFQIELYGTCDELNSFIGVTLSMFPENRDQSLEQQFVFLQNIQSRLFDLGSLLACEKNERDQFKLPQLDQNVVDLLEEKIDLMDGELAPLKNFILPGGDRAASFAHVCRTVCRRLERMMVKRDEQSGDLPDFSLVFINRLSDYFFSLARFVNFKSQHEEVIWAPKKN